MAMITIVGCGPGAFDYLTAVARQAIAEAEVLVGARRLLDLFPEVIAERIIVGADIPGALEKMAQIAQIEKMTGAEQTGAHAASRKIAVLVSGDPGVCSLAQPVLRRFGRASCRVIPGISSVQTAFARLGLDWFGARLVSAHRQTPDTDPAALATEEKIAVLAGNTATNEWIAVLAEHLAATHAVFVCQDLTLPEEQVRQLADGELTPPLFSSRSVVLFIKKEFWHER
jgi:precorrin-6y C5,15-methyltransferase (decarboxylating) CbiE subunit